MFWLHALVQIAGISRVAKRITKYEFLGRIDLQYGRWPAPRHRRAVVSFKAQILEF